MEEQSGRIDPVALFPAEMQPTVQDLAFLGYKRRDVTFAGHTFVLETIRPYLKHAISLVIEPYRNTLMQPLVWASAHVGVSLASVNGDTAFCPAVQDSIVGFVEARIRWLTGPTGYWEPTIDYLMGQYSELEQEAQAAVAEAHRFAERSRGTSQPSPDSSTAPGLFGGLTAGATQPTETSS